MPSLPYIETVETLRMASCPQCGLLHALPAAAFIAARRDQTPIHCPHGHAWVPMAENAEPSSNPVQSRIEFNGRYADLQLKYQVALLRLKEVTPEEAAPPDAAEMRRRCQILAGRADPFRGEHNHKICPMCGRKQSQGYMHNHLRRRHSDAIAKKPGSFFDTATDRILARFE